MTLRNFKRLLVVSGAFNIIAAFLFIFPFTYKYYINFFNRFNDVLELGGKKITIPTDIFHALFINTAGIDLVLIGIIVLLVSKDPMNKINRKIILFNGLGRTLFALIITYYALVNELIRIFVAIGFIDVVITIGFIYYLCKLGIRQTA
jgi:hypothetical protein